MKCPGLAAPRQDKARGVLVLPKPDGDGSYGDQLVRDGRELLQSFERITAL